jgi:hypothetical protein
MGIVQFKKDRTHTPRPIGRGFFVARQSGCTFAKKKLG